MASGRGVCVVADARIDQQLLLKAKLRGKATDLPPPESDAELILHAYLAWGEECLDHLIGDFAFALWDRNQCKLLCARDHLGVRPLFYTRGENRLTFASDLDALFEDKALSRDLDDGFVADFLIFGGTVDPALTVYRKAQRLPAAHKLVVQNGRTALVRYWSLPDTPEPRLRSSEACQEAFQEIFVEAVKDRTQDVDAVALELSGGMDSGAIAAALRLLSPHRQLDILAYTNISPKFLPQDKEGDFATLTANHLDLNHRFWSRENPPFYRWRDSGLAISEPVATLDLAASYDQMTQMAGRGARILLTGQTGDALFAGQNYYRHLIYKGGLLQVAREIWRASRYTGSVRGLGLRGSLLGQRPPVWRSPLPRWISPDFARTVDLEARWTNCWDAWNSANGLRGQFGARWISSMFEGYTRLKVPLVTRHPFADIRLVQFMLNMPNAELINKKILRETLGSCLPEQVRGRRKTPLAGDLTRNQITSADLRQQLPDILEGVERYVNIECYQQEFDNFCRGAGMETTWTSALIITPLALSQWLKARQANY